MKRLFYSLSLAILLLLSLTMTAQASTITPYSSTGFVIGWKVFHEGFTVPVPGEYQATIVDFATPGVIDAFDTLLFAITTFSPLGFVDIVDGAGGTGTFTFMATPGVNYVASIAAIAGDSHIGLFGAEVSLVPVPQTLLLLASGLISLVVLRRRSR